MLRVAVMLRESVSKAWVTSLLDRMQQSGFAQVVALLAGPPKAPQAAADRPVRRWERALFGRYEAWDHRRHADGPRAWAPAVLPELQQVAAGDEAALQALQLDVLLVLEGTDGLRETDLPQGVAHFGTWVLEVGNRRAGEPPLWREHRDGAAEVPTRLLCLDPPGKQGEGPALLYETYAAVDPSSLAQTRDPVYWKAVDVILRALQAVNTGGAVYLQSLPPAAERNEPSPQALGMGRFAWCEAMRRVHARNPRSRRATFAKWCIGLRPRRADVAFSSEANFRLLVSPRDRFYADPFLFERDGRTWLFFEDFRYPEGKAVISCCELDAECRPGEAFEVLRLPWHLSYPFVFEEGGTVYMMPESRGHRTVSLYRATSFPEKWEHAGDLFAGVDMVDSTLHRTEDGTWWLFAGVSNGLYSNSDELCVYFADAFLGPWTPHPQNPVVSSVRQARPAGRLFCDGSRLIRPAQDCGPAYGYGLVFAEVEELSREVYRERLLAKVLPESVPGNTANHTYTRTGKFEATDRFFIESRLGHTDTWSGLK